MSDAALLSISVDRAAPRPLFLQVYDDLRAHILAGRLAPNAQLPPSRVFADELGLSRSTVTAAYDQLVSEGYARGRRGAGIFVSELPEATLQARPAAVERPGRPSRPSSASLPQPRPFRTGEPDMRLFPYREWAKAIARVSRTAPASLVLTDDPFGDRELRRALSDHLAEWRGIAAPPERIIVTAGAAGALELIFRALTRRGDVIALEEPGYPPLARIAESMGLAATPMPVGPEGADPDCLEDAAPAPKLVFLTPSHQFPLGGAMPLKRRLDFLDYASRSGCHLVEDDFDSEFRYAGRPIPAMAGLGGRGRVLYVGSLSKIFATNLRLGYLVVPDHLEAVFRQTLSDFGIGTSSTPQRPLAEFMRSGEFHRHIRRMRRIYAARRKVFFELIETRLIGLATAVDHQAGMTVLLRLPDGTDDAAIAAEAQKRGVTLRSASEFFSTTPAISGLLAGFSAFEPEEMVAPMETLRDILAAHVGR